MLRQAANNRNRVSAAQRQEAALIVEQFPGQRQRFGHLAQDADLALVRLFIITPLLQDTISVPVKGKLGIEALADLAQQMLDLPGPLQKLLEGPLPVFF